MVSRDKKLTDRSRTGLPSKEIAPERRRKFWLIILGTTVVAMSVVYWALESPQAYYRRAQRLLSKQPAQCEQLAERAIFKAGGNYPDAQLLQCQALAAMKEWDAALGGFTLINDATSCPLESLLDLGANALEANELQLADRALQAARVPGPFFSRATELLIRLNMKLQLRDEALELCREWQAAAPADPLPWVIAAEIEVSRFELATAIADYQEALRRSPSSELEKSIRSPLSNLLLHTGDLVAARAQFNKLAEAGSITGNTQLDHVQLLRLEGRLTEAQTEIENYLTTVKKSPEALKRRGMIRMDLGQWDEALADLKAAVAGNEFDIGAHHLLAQIYLRQGKPELAQPQLEKSRRLTEATFRISELKELLREKPTKDEWKRELKTLEKVVGH